MKPQSMGSPSPQRGRRRPEVALELENVVRQWILKAQQQAPSGRAAPKPS